MPRQLMMGPWPLFCALLLTACASKPEPIVPPVVVRKELVPQPIPGDLLTCAPQPPVPGATATQRDVGQFIIDLAAAGADCRGKVAAVREIVRTSN